MNSFNKKKKEKKRGNILFSLVAIKSMETNDYEMVKRRISSQQNI